MTFLINKKYLSNRRLVIYKLFVCSPITSHVGYLAGKPIDSVVYYFFKITLSKTESTDSPSMSLPAQ